jgi:hypothetical protein
MSTPDDARARDAAKRVGLRAFKSRHAWDLNDQGGFCVMDRRGIVVMGVSFNATTDDVVHYCRTLRPDYGAAT